MRKKTSSFGKIAIYMILAIALLGILGNMFPSEQSEAILPTQTLEETASVTSENEERKTEESKNTSDIQETYENKTEQKDEGEQPSTKESEDSSVSDPTQSGNGLLPKENDQSVIPPYDGDIFVIVNDNVPFFSSAELTTTAYESYSNLDSLGRCGVALASCGKEIMPAPGEERGSISNVYPSGWVQAKYDGISGGYLYNRCHLLGWQLSAENANRKNLITGTRAFNVDGMLPFENMVADYIKETGNHVAYRVSPLFEGNNLVATGVRMEAFSVEDQGEGICFHVFVYNVQPGFVIDYSSGKSSKSNASPTTSATAAPTTTTAVPPTTTTVYTTTTRIPQTATYILNTNTKKIHRTTCRHVSSIKDSNRQSYSGDLNNLYAQGYQNCKTCF